ncbi:MAG: hypothetical protein ILO42_07845 [Clostridia bacterium]|nr:hypothetical protein [Clostridia bacterium]
MTEESKRLMGRAADPDLWKTVASDPRFERYRREVENLYANYAQAEIPQLSYSDFKLFFVTGDRSTYEKKYFARRLAMDSAALMALIYPEKDEYVARLSEIIWQICDEYTWCLPAHQKQIDRNDNCVIDLFASETGFALAETLTLLGDRLDPLIADRIRAETDRRIVGPFLATECYSWWEKATNNWTAVCEGSVACTFMLMRPELVPGLIPRFEKAMDSFLSGFSSEGICFEGSGYWCYGFGFFTVYADMLRRFTGGKTDRFADPKCARIASFHQKLFLSGRTSVSFSDGGRTTVYPIGLMHFLKKEYPDDVTVYSPEYSYNYDGCGRFCLFLRAASWFDPDIYDESSANRPEDAEYIFEEAEWYIRKNDVCGFAFKGGCNNEPHNHNDVGCFIFAKNGKQCLADVGHGAYTRQYFDNALRYGFAECSSRGHSLPIVDGCLQKFGKEYRTKSFGASPSRGGRGRVSADIAPAYGIDGLLSLERSFVTYETGVKLEDRFGFDSPDAHSATERFVSLEKPEYKDGKVFAGGAVLSSFTADGKKLEPVFSEEKASSGTLYYTDFVLPRGASAFEMPIE